MEDNHRIFKFEGEPGEDFQLWAARTEAALEDKGAWSVLMTDVVGNADGPLREDVLKLVAKARATIMQGLGNNPLMLCLEERSNPYRIWKILQDRYAVVNVATKVQLQSQLSRLVNQNQKMTDFVDSFQVIFNKLAAMGSVVSEDMQVANLLASFGDKEKSPFGHVVAALQASNSTVSWETATARLIQEYDEKAWSTGVPLSSKQSETVGSTVALNANQHRKLAGMSRGYRKRFRKPTLRCWECHEEGHKDKDCFKKKRNRARSQNVNYTDGSANHAMMLMAVATIRHNDKLLLDSGASDHMVRNRDYFVSLHPIEPQTIVLGNGATVTTRAKGDIRVKVRLHSKYDSDVIRLIIIQDVLFVPQLAANLISCSTLCKNGYDIMFKGTRGRAMLNDLIEFQYNLDDGVYVIEGVPSLGNSSAYAVRTATEALWHDRLGHADVGSIRNLARRGAVIGLDMDKPLRKQNDCQDCIKGKQHKLSVRQKEVYSRQRGGVIHSDVSGIMSVPSLGGSRYYVLFIDEYSRYIVVIPIAKKSEVLEKFKRFHAWFERKYECIIKKLHCDNGGEYVACDGYLEVHGIERDESPSYSPELNGLSERVNRTLMESARAMIYHAKMTLSFWAEAVVHAADIRNRFICPRSQTKTAYELLTGTKPRVDHLRVFGSMAWSHVPKEKRKKLDPKSEDCVVIGCFENSMYKVWIRNRRAPAMIRHIRVQENQFHPLSWYSGIESSQHLTNDDEFSNAQNLPFPKPDNRNKDQTMSNGINQPEVLPVQNDEQDTDYLQNSQDLVTYIPVVPSRHGEYDSNSDQGDDDLEKETEARNNTDADDTRRPMMTQPTPVRYPQRKRVAPNYYRPESSFLAAISNEPTTVYEALSIESESKQWIEAINSEMSSLLEHDVWEVVKLPEVAKTLDTCFVLRRKMLHDGTVGRYKARLVVRGYMQGDVDHTYSPVVDFTTIRVALALSVQRKYFTHQMDVKTAFLHGAIDKEVYITPPEGAGIELKPGQALKLKKGLYGLKQAPRLWYEKWKKVMHDLGFSGLTSENCVFKFGSVWVLLYVDDVIIIGPNLKDITDIKQLIARKLEIKDLGTLTEFLGIKFTRKKEIAWLSQSHYINEILKRFGMSDCKPVSTPACIIGKAPSGSEKAVDQKMYQEMIGALMFLTTRNRPDITNAVGMLSLHCANPTEKHLVGVKRALRYLQGTKDFVLRISSRRGPLVGYSDADWAGDISDRKSTSGIVIMLGNTPMFWKSRKQNCVSLSTSEAEYVALTETCKQIVWMRKLLEEFDSKPQESTTVMEDNHGAIFWGSKGIRNAKHVSIRVNFIKEQVEKGIIRLQHCRTQNMIGDILTKPLQRIRFERLRDDIGGSQQNSTDSEQERELE